jgi:hypothetical protein
MRRQPGLAPDERAEDEMLFQNVRRRTRLVGTVGIAAIAAVAATSVALLTVGGASGSTTSVVKTFGTPGTYTWKVPTGVTRVTFDVFGASGGNLSSGGTLIVLGGRGGEARGTFAVTPGQVFEVVVGGRGGDASESASGTGGTGGGGDGGPVLSGGGGGAGGGGASDVRLGGRGNGCASARTCAFPDRIIVGGGGGGAGVAPGAIHYGGGTGGGLRGEPATLGGTQEAGGTSVANTGQCAMDGLFGLGGQGGRPKNCISCWVDGAGGGGGGWYGGAGDPMSGGGSAFISRLTVGGSFPGGTRVGNGRVVISTP